MGTTDAALSFYCDLKPGKKNIVDTLSRLLQKGEGKDFEHTANYVNFITVKAVAKAISAEGIEQAALDDEEMKELRKGHPNREEGKSKIF